MAVTTNVRVIIEARDNASKVLKNVKGQFLGLSKSAQNFGADLQTVGKIGIAASIGLVALAAKAGMTAARVEELGFALTAVAKANKISKESVDATVNSLRGMNIAHQQSLQITAKFIQGQLDLTDAVKLANAAKDLAVIAGMDSSQATQTLTNAILTQFPIQLRQFGIVKSLDQIYGEYAETTGETASSLTDLQKRQAFLNTILKEGQKVAGTYDAAMGSVSKRYRSLTGRIIPDFVAEIGKAFSPALVVAIDSVTDSIKEMGEWLTENKDTVEDFSKSLGTLASIMTRGIIKATKFLIENKGVIVGVLVAIGIAMAAVVVSFVAAHAVVMLAITGITVAFGMLFNGIKNFKAGVEVTVNWFKDTATPAIKSFFETWKNDAQASAEATKTALSNFISWYKSAFIAPAIEQQGVLRETFKLTSDQWADALGQTLQDLDNWVIGSMIRFDLWKMNTSFAMQEAEKNMIISLGNWMIKTREFLDLFQSSWSVGMNFWAETTKGIIKQWAHETYITLLNWSERVWLEAYLPLQEKIRSFIEEKMNQWRVGIPMIWKEIADKWIFQLDRIGNSLRTLGGKIDDARGKISDWWSRVQEARLQGSNFQTGGIVPGPIGQPVPIMAHAGERVIPTGLGDRGGGGGGGIVFEVNIGLYAGAETEKRNIARDLYAALVQVAQSQNKTVRELMGA